MKDEGVVVVEVMSCFALRECSCSDTSDGRNSAN